MTVKEVYWAYRRKIEIRLEYGEQIDLAHEFNRIQSDLQEYKEKQKSFEYDCTLKIREYFYTKFFRELVCVTGNLKKFDHVPCRGSDQAQVFEIKEGEILIRSKIKVYK